MQYLLIIEKHYSFIIGQVIDIIIGQETQWMHIHDKSEVSHPFRFNKQNKINIKNKINKKNIFKEKISPILDSLPAEIGLLTKGRDFFFFFAAVVQSIFF